MSEHLHATVSADGDALGADVEHIAFKAGDGLHVHQVAAVYPDKVLVGQSLFHLLEYNGINVFIGMGVDSGIIAVGLEHHDVVDRYTLKHIALS